MNNWALQTIPVKQFNQEVVSQAHQLSTSKSVQEVCNSINNNLTDSKNETKSGPNLFNVTGQIGSGRSTFCKAVIKTLIQNGLLEESEVVYIKVDKEGNVDCVWNCGIQLAKDKNAGSNAVILASKITSFEAKQDAMVQIWENLKLICFDQFSMSKKNQKMYLLLVSIIHKLKNNVICVSKQDDDPPSAEYGTKVKVDGLNRAVVGSDLNWLKVIDYFNVNYQSVDETMQLNPRAIQMFVNASWTLGRLQQKIHFEPSKNPVLNVLNLIWEHLSDHERVVLYQLSELCRALPLQDANSLSRVVQIGLVEYEPPGVHGNLFGQVNLSDCVHDFVLARKGELKMVETNSTFDVLHCWMVLLSEELVGLIEEARQNSWPFVPEKWQYVKNASQKESHNVKDIITMKVKNLPHLTNFDVLQEILHHSVLRKDYENMAAILFLIDRYIYWQGGSETLLNLVDSIIKEKPEVAIAPQLVIRKARVLRTSGDLQGAEKVLDRLLNEKQMLGKWKYSEEHHHHLVKGVCIQIKGEIQATLGHWHKSAELLLDSVHFFKTLPKVDKKGLSSSLGLLVNTLQRMSIEEFKLISQRYSFEESHPYIQAYRFAVEAAELAVFTPLFYARHKRRAGEMLLEYTEDITDDLKAQYLTNALKELKESLAAHKTLDSLKSREQYYEFIMALYKTCCVLKNSDLGKHLNLKLISMALFSHYCLNLTTIVHDDSSKSYINTAMNILELPLYYESDMYFFGTTERLVYSPESGRTVTPEQGKASGIVDRCAETIETLTFEDFEKSGSSSDLLDENILNNDTMNSPFTSTNDVYECEVSSYDVIHLKWRTHRTLAYIGEPLKLSEDNKGAQRVPFMMEYLGQDEPMGKYLAKRYLKPRGLKQYKEDVRCQMTARYYVGLFNQELYHKGIEVSPIQFLPVVMLQLFTHTGEPTPFVYNVEPYMQGNFEKLTNNSAWVNKEGAGTKLVLSFSHFTFERSNPRLLVTDHQGWTTEDHLSTTFLTDPQIHSVDKEHFGRGNRGKDGIHEFWQVMHEECNEICHKLGLTRPRSY